MKGKRRGRFYWCFLGLIIAGTLSAAPIVQAQEFHIYGLRALGMGGAGVAAVRDASAVYWNPAVQGYFKRDGGELEAEYSPAGGSLSFQVGIQQHEEFGSLVGSILDSDIDSLMDDPEAYLLGGAGVPNFLNVANYSDIYSDLTDFLLDNPGVTVSLTSGLVANFRNFGLGVIALGEAGASTVPDLTNIGIYDTAPERTAAITILKGQTGTPNQYFSAQQTNYLITQIEAISSDWSAGAGASGFVYYADNVFNASPVGSRSRAMEALLLFARAVSAPSFENNNSAVASQGAIIGEVPVSFGYALNKYFSVGANLKLIYAYVSSMKISVDDAESDEYLQDILDNTETAYSFGVDLGIYARWHRLRAGLLGRNLNAPSFDYPSIAGDVFRPLDRSFRLNPQVRAGLAYLLFDSLVLALDLDITDNETFFGELPGGGGHSSRNISFGLEWTPIRFISLRGGCFRNLSSDAIPIVLTAGLGLNLWAFHMDLGAAVSTSTDEITGLEDIGDVTWPTQMNLGMAFSMLF